MSVIWSITLTDRTLRGPTFYRSCGMTSRTHWKWGGWKKSCAWASPWSLMVPDFFHFLHFLEIFCFVDMQRQSTSFVFSFEHWWKAKSESVTTNRRNLMKRPLQSFKIPSLTQKAIYSKRMTLKYDTLIKGLMGPKTRQDKLFST